VTAGIAPDKARPGFREEEWDDAGERREPQESVTPPGPTEDRSGDGVDRRGVGLLAGGASRPRPGGTDRPNMVRGRGLTEPVAVLCRRPLLVAVTQSWLMRCPVAARLKWTARYWGSPHKIAALSVTEKAPEQSGQLTRELVRASGRALLVWGPGAGVEAAGRLCSSHNRTGVASIPQSCRQNALARANLKHGNSAHLIVRGSVRTKEMMRESGFRAAESVTSPELAKGAPGDGLFPTDVRAWGRRTAPRGL